MRIVREELERLREKLRRVELRTARDSGFAAPAQPRSGALPGTEPAHELPPWELAPDESAFESTLESTPGQRSAVPNRPGRSQIEDCLSGSVVETPFGTHFETETLYPGSARHGHFGVRGLERSPDDLLAGLCPGCPNGTARDWVYLDTETTGLSGGAGTFAFLIGLGYVTPDGFLVRQFFLREPAEERSVLRRIAEELERFSAVVTYNGKAYDLPLLETRYRLARSPVPFASMPHVDLLHACRRLWKLRFESCKLTHLEERVLGHERDGDVPGFLIPSLYANYLRFGEAGSLSPVFLHNSLDILSLACLTNVVGGVFRDPASLAVRHGAECVGLGRWLSQAGRPDEALPLLRRAIQTNIPEDLLARTLWDIFEIERKRGQYEAARDAVEQIIGFPNSLHSRALEALSILYERRFKDLPRSLHYARRLERLQPGEKAGARLERLTKKCAKAPGGQIFES
ncbi:MAG: ribonuclease H-like domain-containing protein [Bryobacterales bacterium]|nr:ribonuclease H-like domain-containing protein [Bryobacterales bacterium]